ncbi:hypothetical protein D7231_31975 [Streptomyces klenkii]|uniref:Uncharacterized protein n=1 Tax=Streptomyces klenkii TaxID=1420899 RepID=A0A3B0ANC3_9ACTN|nr:hypothetical protein [Streptomyces klenkii]RKN61891.1 hypothetical protein D7231_31975 [Streptomyces klenkii]
MRAVPERVPNYGRGPDNLIWHKPGGRAVADFQPIACSDTEGLVMPWSAKDVPLDLDEPGQRWCPDCLAVARKETRR